MQPKNSLGSIARDLGRFLTFRSTASDYARFGFGHFLVGFVLTWLVGIARNWDFPQAPLFARLGLPSVAYVFALSLILFALAWPPSPRRAGYGKVLTVVTMTAAPGLIYGIPVEKMTSVDGAMTLNLLFLFIVAVWRVALMFHFLRVGCGNTVGTTNAILFLPIQLILVALVATGRAGYLMDIMGGIRDRPISAQAAVDNVIANLFCFAVPLTIVALVSYGLAVGGRERQAIDEEPSE